MKVFYLGAIIMALQIVASDIIISTGDIKVVGVLMVGSLFLNIFLDMGLIFGRFGLPKMGIVGAALATLISEAAAMTVAFYILANRAKLITTDTLTPGQVLKSWGRILKFAIPGALGMILTPISSAVITRLAAGYGSAAVAALGVASRIEMFAFMIPATVGVPLIPFIAQNYGAKRTDRVRTARKGAITFAVLYGIFIGLLLITFAKPIARIFSTEMAVIEVLCSYIYITAMGYGMMEVHRYAGFTMTGMQKPMHATFLNIIRVIVLLIPLAITGNILLKIDGIFWGRLSTDILAGLVGIWWSGKILSSKQNQATVH
jgi:Na+-driven multidrug efflux pump